jgi:hypothetical protein
MGGAIYWGYIEPDMSSSQVNTFDNNRAEIYGIDIGSVAKFIQKISKE